MGQRGWGGSGILSSSRAPNVTEGRGRSQSDRLLGLHLSVPAFLIPGLLHTFSKTTVELQSTSFYQDIYY